jgi:hypothetical protein
MNEVQAPEPGSVASGVVRAVEPGPEVKELEIFIGNWINDGYLVQNGQPDGKIVTSDVYEWAPGGFFVLHSAYGRLGEADVGGVEIIGYDAGNYAYRAWFFDSQGNATCDQLRHPEADIWIWEGEETRSTSTFTEGGKVQTTHHERLESGAWIQSMKVVLTKVG